jgi:hypothetical protein
MCLAAAISGQRREPGRHETDSATRWFTTPIVYDLAVAVRHSSDLRRLDAEVALGATMLELVERGAPQARCADRDPRGRRGGWANAVVARLSRRSG